MTDLLNHPLAHAEEFFIGGAWTPPSSEDRIQVIAPAREELYVSVAAAREADVDRAIGAARIALDEGPWPRLSHSERADYLKRIALALSRRASDAAAIWPNEMGILHSVATAYSDGVAGVYEAYAAIAETFSFEEVRQTWSGAELGLLVHEPVGVVGAIIPWNGPMSLIAFKLAPALLAGCTAVIKASPEAPGQALLLGEVMEEVGLPKGVVNIITADREVSERLVASADVDKIAFTGSSAAGKRIASLLGARMARYTLELGGKSAAVVLDDYDVEKVAESLATTAPEMTGQVCASLTRVIVERSRHDQMVEALASRFAALRVGDPFDKQSQMGPLATAKQRDRVESYIAKGRAAGFVLACGGGRPAHLGRGYYVEPTIFAGVDNRSAIAQEEIFGPVLSVIPVDSEEEALSTANDTVFGLNNAVFTNDPDRFYRAARRLRSGTVGHNAQRMDFTIAFGGFKESGVGREGGVEGLRPYLEAKTILMDGKPGHIA